MEDYKKKYEEALENIKKIKSANKDNKELVDFIEYEYPELRESEDERIRKELISFITDRKNWFPKEETKASWIAWLEKQSEQKPTDKFEPKSKEKTKFYDSMDDLIADALIEEIENSELDDSSKHNRIYWIKSHRQKPAWSEEDELMLNKAISTIMYALSIPFGKEDDPCFTGSSTISWLKSLKERMKGE